MSSTKSWIDQLARLRARGLRYVAQQRGVSPLQVLERAESGTAVVAADGSYSYAEAGYRARMIALSLRSRGLGREWIGIWAGGRRRDWVPVMAAVGAAGGVWCDGIPDAIPAGGAVVFYGAGDAEVASLDEKVLCVCLDKEEGSVDLAALLAEGGILAGLSGLRRNWKMLCHVDGEPVVRWAPGPFLSRVPLDFRAGYRHGVGEIESDFIAASLAHIHLLLGGTLVFEGEFDPPEFTVYGTARTGLATILRSDEVADHPRSVGRAFPDLDLWIVGENGDLMGASEVGDIWVGHPDVVDSPGIPSGIAATGDRGCLDDDGFLYLVDHARK